MEDITRVRSVVETWIRHAQKREWLAMAQLAQPSWRARQTDAADLIEANYGHFDIRSWQIVAVTRKGSAMFNAEARLETQLGQ